LTKLGTTGKLVLSSSRRPEGGRDGKDKKA